MEAALFAKMLSDPSILDLKKLGYKFPVLYTMEESKADHAWVGTCQEIMPPPAPPVAMKAKRQRRSAKGETA